MDETTSGTRDLRAEAERLLADRVDLVSELGHAATSASEARDALRTAEKREADAWAAATAGGWSRTELQQLGFTAPPSKRGGRGGPQRGRRAHRAGSAQQRAGDGRAGEGAA